MAINKPAAKPPTGSTLNPANGTFHKVGPLDAGKTPTGKPADNIVKGK